MNMLFYSYCTLIGALRLLSLCIEHSSLPLQPLAIVTLYLATRARVYAVSSFWLLCLNITSDRTDYPYKTRLSVYIMPYELQPTAA